MKQHVLGFNQGLFVTIDTQYSGNSSIDDKRLYSFTNKLLNELCNRTHKFCYGRSYIRNENRMIMISSIETGISRERLHAHCIMLHKGDTGRIYEQMSNFVIKNCQRIFKISGNNAYKVDAFEPDRFWEKYFVKDTKKMFYLHDGFMNIDLH